MQRISDPGSRRAGTVTARRHPVWLLVTAVLLAGPIVACDGDGTGPTDPAARIALTSRDAGSAALYVQDLDGANRIRIHFDGVDDPIPGNESQEILPVTDESILALGPVRWSPGGTRLAAVVTVAFDQSQIVLIDADGSNARAASPNTQIILSRPTWSPDGRRLAYTMSTLPHATGIDVFVTDLETNRVIRVTSGAALGIAGVELAWSGDGTELILSRITGESGAPLFEYISSITRINIATGAQAPVAQNIAGQVFGIAPGGTFAIIERRSAFTNGDYIGRLVRRSLTSGQETTLTDDRVLAWAALANGDEDVLFTTIISGSSDALNYHLVPAAGGTVIDIRSITTSASSADYVR